MNQHDDYHLSGSKQQQANLNRIPLTRNTNEQVQQRESQLHGGKTLSERNVNKFKDFQNEQENIGQNEQDNYAFKSLDDKLDIERRKSINDEFPIYTSKLKSGVENRQIPVAVTKDQSVKDKPLGDVYFVGKLIIQLSLCNTLIL